MNTEAQLQDTLRRREQEQLQKQQQQRQAYRAQLLRVLLRKTNTSFIGAIARFEKFFGVLWGHGKALHELGDEERYWLSVWSECRNEVLDNGNHQARNIESELSRYEVDYKRAIVLPVLNRENDDEQ